MADTPLFAIRYRKIKEILSSRVLTADCNRVLKDLGHLWVHMYHDVLLVGHFAMSGIHLVLHPVIEPVLEHGCADIGDPLLRRLGQLELGLGQIFVYLWMVLVQELSDLPDSQALVSIFKKRYENEVHPIKIVESSHLLRYMNGPDFGSS